MFLKVSRSKKGMGAAERILELEEELRNAQYNKATEHHFGIVKAKIALLREKAEKEGTRKKGTGFAVKKSGDATVVLLGFPSVGKSTLLNSITKAQSKIGAYEFTTLNVVPGLMEYNFAKIQVLDLPGIIKGAAQGKGRGREILSIVRNADLIMVLIEAKHPEHYHAILKEISDAGIRINRRKPDIRISKRAKGGIGIGSTVKLTLNKKIIQDILKEMKVNNADVIIRSPIDIDALIDAVAGNRQYIPAITIVTKTDMVSQQDREKLERELKPDLFVSAEQKLNIDELKELIFQKLNFIRIFLKEVNQKPDLDVPMIVRRGTTIADICNKIHRAFIKKFRFAKIWGKSAKFPGQMFIRLDKELEDGDIVEIHIS